MGQTLGRRRVTKAAVWLSIELQYSVVMRHTGRVELVEPARRASGDCHVMFGSQRGTSLQQSCAQQR